MLRVFSIYNLQMLIDIYCNTFITIFNKNKIIKFENDKEKLIAYLDNLCLLKIRIKNMLIHVQAFLPNES